MTGWTLRVVWPVEDLEMPAAEALAEAEADLPNVAGRSRAVLTGDPTFQVVECDPEMPWPTTLTAVVCEVPALPAVTRIATRTTPTHKEAA